MIKRPSLITETQPLVFSHNISLAAPVAGRVVPIDEVDDLALHCGVWGSGVAIATRATVCCVPFDGVLEQADLASQRWVLKAKNGLRVMLQLGPLSRSLYAERLQPQLSAKQPFTRGQVLTYLDPVWLKSQIGEVFCIVTVLTTKNIVGIMPNRLGQQIEAMDDLMQLYLNIAKTG